MYIKVKKIIAVVLLCSVALLSPAATMGKGKIMRRAPGGTWGGEHIRLTVNRDDAVIEYDCGGGTIDGPLLLDRRGNFSVRGTHTRGHGGPIRLGEPDNRRTAFYAGKISGKTMTLNVKLDGSNEPVATYTLRQGVESRLHRCL